MLRLPAPATLNGSKLREELADAGMTVGVREMVSNGAILEFSVLTAEHRDRVAAVLAAHTGAKSTLEANEDTLRQRIQAAIATNNAYVGLVNPTAAQKDAQLLRVTKECTAFGRLLLGLLDDITGT